MTIVLFNMHCESVFGSTYLSVNIFSKLKYFFNNSSFHKKAYQRVETQTNLLKLHIITQ